MKQRLTRLVWAGLAGCLLVSVVANVVLLRQGQQYYLDLNATRLDPLGLDLLEPVLPLSEQPRVVFFGDSRAVDWPTPETVTDFDFVNRVLDAQASEQVLGRYHAHIQPLQAQYVLVQVGINDLKTIPLFPDRQAAIVAAC